MQKILFLALFAAAFFSCSKEPQQLTQVNADVSETINSDITETVVFTADDREGGAYQFGLTNSTLPEYCFKISVTQIPSQKEVWNQGGCYTGNRFFTVYLTPGQQYAATLTFTPPHPEQHGTIHWWLRNYQGYVMCNQGDMGIPSGQSLLWTACQ